jgi:catechol 2,3-dioxygenase-like lactoylglutathione lyase family enzyme
MHQMLGAPARAHEEDLTMLNNTKSFASFSVDDLSKAKDFYARTLGLGVDEEPEGLEIHLSGDTKVFVYPSADYTPPQHTVLNFVVDDIDEAIDWLTKRGVRMEHYDRPDIKTDDRGIFRSENGPEAVAWFKDPAGHVLSVIQER